MCACIHHMDNTDFDVRVLDRRMSATKTNPAYSLPKIKRDCLQGCCTETYTKNVSNTVNHRVIIGELRRRKRRKRKWRRRGKRGRRKRRRSKRRSERRGGGEEEEEAGPADDCPTYPGLAASRGKAVVSVEVFVAPSVGLGLLTPRPRRHLGVSVNAPYGVCLIVDEPTAYIDSLISMIICHNTYYNIYMITA